jgi:hypothetical protein
MRPFLTFAFSLVMVISFFFVGLSTIAVSGWDTDGHWVVALIAGEHVRDRTARYLTETMRLNGQDLPRSLAFHAIWADQQVYDPAYAWTKPLHFAYTDEQCSPFEMNRDCPQGKCIVSGISDFADIASRFGTDKHMREEALKFVIHLVGDLHQPLHIGFRKDDGGTSLILTDPATTLHNVWDETLMERFLAKMGFKLNYYDLFKELSRELEGEDLGKYRFPDIRSEMIQKGEILDVISGIASETSSKVTCPFGYAHMDGITRISRHDILSDDWIKSRQRIMLTQLKKAGLRLAQLLDSIATVYYEAEKHSRRNSIPKKVISAKRLPINIAEKNVFALLDEASTTSEEDYSE